jgi:hypothetical protein
MSRIKNVADFISRAVAVHGDKYDYSRVVYTGRHNKIVIVCPIHGEFLQTPANHYKGFGCSECSKEARDEKQVANAIYYRKQIIDKFISVHGEYYDYHLMEYCDAKTKVRILCPIHGEFWQTPDGHISGNGCPMCAKNRKDDKNSFIKKAQEAHGYFYEYSKVVYMGSRAKIEIVCPIHGEFWQRPSSHTSGAGCPKCASAKQAKASATDVATVLAHFQRVHADTYDYSEVHYTSRRGKVRIRCKVHNIEFMQAPAKHIAGTGCPLCGEYGFQKGKPGLLYYIKIKSHNLWKIGITNRKVEERFNKRDLMNIEVLWVKSYENGQDCYDEEQWILRQFKHLQYLGPKVLTSGNTEIFTEDITKLKEYIEHTPDFTVA